MANIICVNSAFPKHRYPQNEIMNSLKTVWPEHEAVIDKLKESSQVHHRNFVLPLESYFKLEGFEARNNAFIEQILKTLIDAIEGLQGRTGFDWKDLAIVTSTTITGIAVPSIEARLMNRLPIPHNVIRNPLFGLGCLGGVAALNRTKDLLKAYPNKLALILAAEACSLTFQWEDINMANMVACSLFGDGAAAVLMAGDDHPLAFTARLKIKDSANQFYPDTERIMGWDMINSGFKIVLSGNVPAIVNQHIKINVKDFLKKNRKESVDINHMFSHPGGPKVLQALTLALEKEDSFFQESWNSLSAQGNMSSVSVLNVIERSMIGKGLSKGHALALAMGPAFNAEMSLIEVMN